MANGLRSPWHFQAGPTTRKCLPRLQSNSSQAADLYDSDIKLLAQMQEPVEQTEWELQIGREARAGGGAASAAGAGEGEQPQEAAHGPVRSSRRAEPVNVCG